MNQFNLHQKLVGFISVLLLLLLLASSLQNAIKASANCFDCKQVVCQSKRGSSTAD